MKEKNLDFDLTEEQKAIHKVAEEFAKGEFDKKAILGLERNHQYPFAILKILARRLRRVVIHSFK